ncbi:MAG: hypothetical protein OYH77_00580, partial [Pseudomonadota bacterium]|nr:hypothetical protein [Pseudomonadota bacterium]
MNRTSLVAILACALFYMLYSQYLASKYPRPQPTAATAQSDAKPDASHDHSTSQSSTASTPATIDTSAPNNSQDTKAQQVKRLSKAELTFSNADLQLQYSQDIGGFTAIELHNYRQEAQATSANVNLSPNTLRIWNTVGLEPFPYSVEAQRHGNTLKVWYRQDGWHVSQELTFPEQGYGLEVLFRFKNTATKARELEATIGFEERVN